MAYRLYRGFYRFATEERIAGTFLPIVAALDNFQTDNRAAATNLAQLVPLYLARMPSPPGNDVLEYHARPDGTNWQLSIHSRSLKPARVYLYRSTYKFTEEEEKRRITAFHGCVVLKE